MFIVIVFSVYHMPPIKTRFETSLDIDISALFYSMFLSEFLHNFVQEKQTVT